MDENKDRVGRILVSDEMSDGQNKDLLDKAFDRIEFEIIKSMIDELHRCTICFGTSPYFRELKAGERIPDYVIEFNSAPALGDLLAEAHITVREVL